MSLVSSPEKKMGWRKPSRSPAMLPEQKRMKLRLLGQMLSPERTSPEFWRSRSRDISALFMSAAAPGEPMAGKGTVEVSWLMKMSAVPLVLGRMPMPSGREAKRYPLGRVSPVEMMGRTEAVPRGLRSAGWVVRMPWVSAPRRPRRIL